MAQILHLKNEDKNSNNFLGLLEWLYEIVFEK